jgi:Peptidase family C25
MQAVTTAVTLMSFAPAARDRAVDLSWATASELDNLGFHLYRSLSAEGSFERITSAVIPGLGSSANGTSYTYRDPGLMNGVTYFYKLEDIDASGVTTLHGPVSATPSATTTADDGDSDPSSSPGNQGIPYGDPAATSLKVLERDSRHVVLELRTGGFYATQGADGSVELSIPGFDDRSRPGDPTLPTRHTWVEAVAGRKVQLTSVQASDLVSFPGLRPSPAATPAMDVSRNGIVRPVRSPRHESASFRRGVFPRRAARVLGTGFQEETKKAELELAPLRFNPLSGTLVLSRRLLVCLDFAGVDSSEVSLGGSRGRRPTEPRPLQNVSAQLVVHHKGLYRISFADLFGLFRTAIPVSGLRLTHQGQPVAFHVDRASFGPGSSLYFRADSASLDSYPDAVYQLTRKTGGLRMTVSSASAYGASTPHYLQRLDLEQNKTYQSGLLDAPNLWLWDVLVSPVTKTYPFSVDQLASTSNSPHLTVWLQGASDFDVTPDHHLRVSVNGTPLGEASWDGKQPKTIEADLTPGVLLEGQNELEIENVGDTPAAYSLVLLDRFSLTYPRLTAAVNGVLEGRFSESGTVEVSGLGVDTVLLDTTGTAPRWLAGASLGGNGLRFHAEADHSYMAVSSSALLRPEVRRPLASSLKNLRNRAAYLLVGPRDFLATAQPLLDLRQSQGLVAKAVAIEDVYNQFGFGEASPDALKAFLAFAYHHWQKPSPRYVLLLGDGTYDPKDYLKTGVLNRVPPVMVKTSYLWTASDPVYAAVNGSDSLPDLALGRLPAQTKDEARIMIDKIVAFESQGRDFSGSVVMVADNGDVAGNFEQDSDDVASSVLRGRPVGKIYLRDLGGGTRPTIQTAFDNGPAMVNYVGHGGIAVWASENIWNNLDVNTLSAQSQQPLLFTMNCLNGYFHFPQPQLSRRAVPEGGGQGRHRCLRPQWPLRRRPRPRLPQARPPTDHFRPARPAR